MSSGIDTCNYQRTKEEILRQLAACQAGEITQEELKDGMFSFMAKVLNGQDDTYLRARIKNSETNGRWITASGEDYTTRLALGRNEITLLLKRGSEIIGQVTYVINYRAAMANADEPEKGLNPPKIRTNLGGDVVTLTNRNLTFTVWATDGDENPINQNHVTVMMDGKVVKHSTGDAVNGLEYNLFLDTGIAGDETEHTVTIVAWDDKGNSTYKSYKIIYKVRDTGEKIGTATIRLDLTVLGLGLVDVPVSQDIFQDVPASHAVVAALEYLGYDVDFDGSLDTGFYLTRITRSSMLDVIRQDYLRTARAKGVSEKMVIRKHALKNALIPIITVFGSTLGNLLGGAVAIETVFSWPGIGRLTVSAINTRDITLATGCIIMFTVLLTVTMLLVDIAYAYVDPRIKAQYSK